MAIILKIQRKWMILEKSNGRRTGKCAIQTACPLVPTMHLIHTVFLMLANYLRNTKVGKSFIILRELLRIHTLVISTMNMLLRELLQSVLFDKLWREIHSFKYFFENGFRFEEQNFDKLISYFEIGANHYSEGLDYFGHVKYESTEGFWFMHKMSEIIVAIRHNGIEIEEFEEYPFDLDGDFDQGTEGKFPFSYLITAKKK